MKTFKTLPQSEEHKAHFNKYAKTIKRFFVLSLFAQFVSIGTEAAIMNGLISDSISKYMPNFATPLSILITVFAVAALELGLRALLPISVQAFLFKRWKGLEAVISGFAVLMCCGLLTISGLFSFQGSAKIAETIIKPPAKITTDSITTVTTAKLAELDKDQESKRADYEQRNTTKVEAKKAAFAAKIGAAKTTLQKYRTKQANEGKLYTSKIQQQKQIIADLKAEEAEQLAALSTALDNQLNRLDADYTKKANAINTKLMAKESEADAENKAAAADVKRKQQNGGSVLGWFTVLCLALLVAYNILNESFKKLSNTHEVIEVNDSYFQDGFFKSLFGALGTAINVNARRVINWVEVKTPEFPEPAAPFTLYNREGISQQVSEAQPVPRRKVGFKVGNQTTEPQPQPMPAEVITNKAGFIKGAEFKNATFKAHEPNRQTTTTAMVKLGSNKPTETTKQIDESLELWQLKQRLKRYKKNIGTHTQKAIKLQKAGKDVPKRTTEAIQNNKAWADAYQQRINQVIEERKK